MCFATVGAAVVSTHSLDLRDTASCEATIKAACESLGGLDLLVNNAAANPYFGPMLDVDMGAWQKTFEVNLQGYFWMARGVARHLRDRGADPLGERPHHPPVAAGLGRDGLGDDDLAVVDLHALRWIVGVDDPLDRKSVV